MHKCFTSGKGSLLNLNDHNPNGVFKRGIDVVGKSPVFDKPNVLDLEDKVGGETTKLLTQEPQVAKAKIIQEPQLTPGSEGATT